MITETAMIYHDIATVLPSMRPDDIDRMPYAQILQLRALAWAKMPGIKPLASGRTWVDDELEKALA